MNEEGYNDPTAESAMRKYDYLPKNVWTTINQMRSIAAIAGFDVIDRIKLKDRKTGEEYR